MVTRPLVIALACLALGPAACDSGGGGGAGDTSLPDAADDTGPADGDVAGPDATDADATDADGDAGPGDTSGSDALAIDPAGAAAFCGPLCGEILAACGGTTPAGATVAACTEACETQGAADGWALARFQCLAEKCEEAPCFGGPGPLPVDPACPGVCEKLDACDALDLVELPEDEPGVCVASCAGSVVGRPGTSNLVTCLEDLLDPPACTDPQGALDLCAEVAADCGDICETIFEPPDRPKCGVGDPLVDTLSSEAACIATCLELDGQERIRLMWCAAPARCGDISACVPPATEPLAACEAGCDAGFGLCDALFGGAPTRSVCADRCTGVATLTGAPPATAGDAALCVADAGTCPAGEGKAAALLYGCVLDAPDDCIDICGAVAGCGLGLQDALDCLEGCAGAAPSDPGLVATVKACVDAAAGNCDAIEACLPDDEDLGCDGLCGAFFEAGSDELCDPGTAFASVWDEPADCVSACEPLDEGARLAFFGCLLGSDCGDPSSCLSAIPPDPTCGAACESADATCAGGWFDALPGGGCAPFCSGILQTAPFGVAAPGDAAACLGALGGCPPDEDARLAAFFGCVITGSETCVELCSQAAECDEDPEDAFFGCIGQCAGILAEDPSDLDPLVACFDAAVDCPDRLACLASEAPPLLCDLACGKAAACAGGPPDPGCPGACAAAVAAGAAEVGVRTCQLAANCAAIGACDGLAAGSPPAACAAACDGAGACTDLGPEACAWACAGVVAGEGLDAEAAAACVVAGLGPACDAANVAGCGE